MVYTTIDRIISDPDPGYPGYQQGYLQGIPPGIPHGIPRYRDTGIPDTGIPAGIPGYRDTRIPGYPGYPDTRDKQWLIQHAATIVVLLKS